MSEEKTKPVSYKLSDVETLVIKDSNEIYNQYQTLGHIFSTLQKVYTSSVPTQAMGFDEKAEVWTLYINPNDYCKQPTPEHRKACLLHEIWHLLNEHQSRWKELLKMEPESKKKELKHIANMAADLVTNKLIEDVNHIKYTEMMPDDCTYAKLGMEPGDHDTMELLYEKIKNNPSLRKKAQSMFGKGDGSHEKWEQAYAQMSELAKQKLREMIENAKAATNGFGDLPADVRGMITNALKAKVNIERELMIEGCGSIKSFKRLTHNRPNRRHGFPMPGKKSSRNGKVLVGVDVSGSVHTEWKQKFLSIIQKVAKYVDIELIAFDVQVVHHIPNWRFQAKGFKDTCGGTDPQCVFDMAKKSKPDKIFILTDGEFDHIETFGFKTVFVIPPQGNKRSEGKCLMFE